MRKSLITEHENIVKCSKTFDFVVLLNILKITINDKHHYLFNYIRQQATYPDLPTEVSYV